MSTLLTAVGDAVDAENGGVPSGGCDTSSAEERIRSRELAQYFTAASIVPGKTTVDGAGASDDIETPPRLAKDPTLTALSQLGALKLQTARSFISIIDRSHQYVICEATRSISLRDSAVHVDGDGLFLGVRALDLGYGVCPQTIQVFTNTPPEVMAIDNEVIQASRDYYIIRDFRAHPDLRDRPYVTGEPYMRSYLEVPLASDRGFVIGSYCVVDDKPRSFNQAEITVLTEIAGTIIQHLDLLRANVDLQRTRALVRGLGMYVDGYSSLSERRSTSIPEGEADNAEPALGNGNAGSLEDGDIPAPVTHHESPSPASEANVEVIPRTDMNGPRRLSEYGKHASQEIRNAFSRASNLILQSMDASGVAFLDANECDNNQPQHDVASSQPCAMLGVGSSTFDIEEGLLRRLLAAYPVGHVFSSDEYGIVPGGNINRDARLANHPSRRTFRSKQSSDVAEESHDMAELLGAIPGASSVLFLPLWSFRKEKWYAAAVCWTNDATRVYNAEDLHYLSAFGNSIMAEVARAEAAAVSSAKSDFISSISHELKSPLHGILAGVDLLREASGPALDSSSLGAISSCGMMLLDTVNHLLDFAKINFLSTPSTASRDGRVAASKLCSINLADVVQDVVEGLHLAYSKRHLYGEDPHTNTIGISPSTRDLSPGCTPAGKSPEDVIILVDIDASTDWHVRSEIGAWKRCIMNILGNALKFTETGHISIRLSTADLLLNERWNSRTEIVKHVCLEIEDTGRGMSKEFIAGGLFTPFVQENTLSVGTGLGLSIVQQLARGLGGRVEVESEQGVGTKLSVLIPLGELCAPLPGETGRKGSAKLDAEGRLRNRRVYLPPSATDEDLPSNRTEAVQRLLADTCSSWLGMTTSTSEPSRMSDGDFVIRPAVGPQGSLDHLWTVEVVDSSRKRPTQSSPMFPQEHFSPLTQPFAPRSVSNALLQALRGPPGPLEISKPAGGYPRKRTASQDGPFSPTKSRKLSICGPEDRDRERPKLHLLLVDDNSVNLRVLAMTVEKVGCTVMTARDGQEAVEAVINNHNTPGNRHFDWIFMDMSMPVMDGSTATRKIRSWEREADVSQPARILALTAMSGAGAESEAVSSGCDMFLSKPVSINKLRQVLEQGRAGPMT